ncbi:8914_t:CDS:1 [Funneliformis geosporum]|uniref:535_t:CDS:1 n=1 Tax=Funneliformis geosporum TaxID=1117311 RepID=A0A9W4WWD6_9GLOM|nr:535_t:CDS:1 [Funneliformis geosporum]CAI2192108.1 8914_t:CDS:1 [Funneliformis geosporum]
MRSAYCYLVQSIVDFVEDYVFAIEPPEEQFNEKHSNVPVPRLPTECMQEIFKNIKAQGSRLYPCLLVNRYWCKNVVHLLWSHPFVEDLLPVNRCKLIHTYLACLDRQENLGLNSLLRHYNIEIPETRQPIFNYAMWLEEFSYKQLEMAVHSTIHIWCNKTFTSRHKEDQILLITTTLCKLFMRQSNSLKSFIIDKYFSHSDIPQVSTFAFTQPGLSQLTRFQIDYSKPMTINTIQLVESLPALCSNILCLDIKFHKYEYNLDMNKAISRIIRTQKGLTEFHISGIINSEEILLSLPSRESLNTIQLEHVYITESGFDALARCKKLSHLSLWDCKGFVMENNTSVLQSKFSLSKLKLGLSSSCNKAGLILHVGGSSLKELEIDLINPEIVETILNVCSYVERLKLVNLPFDDDDHDDVTLFHSLFSGLYLEKLEIFTDSKNSAYKHLRVSGQVLPPSLKYLKLKCGFTLERLNELFKTCVAPLETIIVDYLGWDYNHLKVITRFIKNKKSVKVLGIARMDHMTPQEVKELKILKKRYGVFIIPSHELDLW